MKPSAKCTLTINIVCEFETFSAPKNGIAVAKALIRFHTHISLLKCRKIMSFSGNSNDGLKFLRFPLRQIICSRGGDLHYSASDSFQLISKQYFFLCIAQRRKSSGGAVAASLILCLRSGFFLGLNLVMFFYLPEVFSTRSHFDLN